MKTTHGDRTYSAVAPSHAMDVLQLNYAQIPLFSADPQYFKQRKKAQTFGKNRILLVNRSGGIWEAMITTGVGLTVAIPLLLLLPSGEILLDGQSTPLQKLEETLSAMIHANSTRPVRLKGDCSAQFGTAIKIIDAARNAGAESLDILTDKP
jgi:hypothetical protein